MTHSEQIYFPGFPDNRHEVYREIHIVSGEDTEHLFGIPLQNGFAQFCLAAIKGTAACKKDLAEEKWIDKQQKQQTHCHNCVTSVNEVIT